MSGPIGKRDEERRRRNKPAVETIKVNLDETLVGEVEIPAPPMVREIYDEETGELEELDEPYCAWDPTAEAWYMSLTRSGQSIFYEPSDWAMAWMIAEQISLAKEPRPVQIGVDSDGKPQYRTMIVPMPGSTLTAILKASSALMTTEGERRRLKIELERKRAVDAALAGDNKVVSIAKTREAVFKREDRSELA